MRAFGSLEARVSRYNPTACAARRQVKNAATRNYLAKHFVLYTRKLFSYCLLRTFVFSAIYWALTRSMDITNGSLHQRPNVR